MRNVSIRDNSPKVDVRQLGSCSILPKLHDTNEARLYSCANTFQGTRVGTSMSNYQQAVRDVIFKAVEREIPIYVAATMIEAIIRTEIDGE